MTRVSLKEKFPFYVCLLGHNGCLIQKSVFLTRAMEQLWNMTHLINKHAIVPCAMF